MTALIGKASALLNKFIPAGLAVKGLSKINPQLSSFILEATAAGYTAENIADFIRDRLSPSGEQSEKKRLELGEQQQNLTPQEKNILAKKNEEGGISKAIGAGVGLATGLAGIRQAPQNIAQQAGRQSKQPPSLPPPEVIPEIMSDIKKTEATQKFAQHVKKQRLTDELSDQFQQGYGQPEKRNIIEQYSPELFQFLKSQIDAGRPPLETASLALTQEKFKSIIKKIEEDHKTPFISILQSIFGEGLYPTGQQQQSAGPGMQKLMDLLQQRVKK